MSIVKNTLGELCIIEKGKVGIQKAIPGEFPLVVTAEERLSHNEYHFEGNAVVIPLVSSTGHGHKSLKRIHFQSGKFAVGNILCAVMPKDETVLNAEYLYRFLDLNREKELVGRMKGMANVSLPLKEIALIEIPLPPVEEQLKFVEEYKQLETAKNKLDAELTHQLALVKQLRQSFLREAMQGKLTADFRSAHPDLIEGKNSAQALLEKIKTEKKQLIKDGKLKKEKELAPLSADEIPFEIPDGWVWCRLGEICEIKRGVGPKYSNIGANKILNQKCVRWYNVDLQFAKTIQSEWFESIKNKYKLRINDILVNSTGDGTIGRSAIIEEELEEYVFDSHILKISANNNIDNKLVCFYINSDYGQFQVEKSKGATSTKQTELGVNNLSNFIYPLPPLSEQQAIVSKLDELIHTCDELGASISSSQEYNEELFRKTLEDEFNIEISAPPLQVLRVKQDKNQDNLYYDNTYMELVELLQQYGRLHAKDLWKMSMYPDDIDKFYAELKAQIEVKKTIKESPEKGYLELV